VSKYSSAVAAAQTRLTEAVDVADAYAAQVLRRKAAWEADPAPETYARYAAAAGQYRAARTHVADADAGLDDALKDTPRHAA